MMHLRNGKEPSDTGAAAPDAELVLAARRGDKRAFVEIVARHQAMVCGIALGILSDFAASEDAAQEAFLTAWRKIHELREPERLRAWLAQIARNVALGHLRRRRGHESLDNAPALADETPRPDEAAASEDEAALVRASLAKLPETYRLPLVLYYREGQSVRAVAEALDLSEDAVKQRLARGREMLREQMSGVIETVLTRTGPTALFTMAIAVAIGALATPAVVAGSVFTTTVAAGSASAYATASTTFLTAVGSTKTVLMAAAVIAVACIPVGYQIPTSTPPPAEIKPDPQAQTEATAPAQKPAPSFENSLLFAEWQKLHDVHGRTAEAMPALHKAINELKDPFRRRAFHTALVAEWAQLDPAAGMKFFFVKGRDGRQRRQFFEEWLGRDAPAAVDGLLAMGKDWEEFTSDSLMEIARHAPSRLGEVVARLPKPEGYWDTSVRDAFALAAANDLSATLRAALALSGPNRDQALAGAVQAWAKSDLQGAMAWVKRLPDGIDRDEITRAALAGKASVDPVAALDLAGSVPAGGRFSFTTGGRVLQEAAKADFERTVAWLVEHPGRLGYEDLGGGLAEAVTTRLNADVTSFLQKRVEDGSFEALVPAIGHALLNQAGGQRAAVWEWLKTQPENEATKSLKGEVLQTAAWQEPELTLRWVADLPQTPEGDRQVSELATNLFNGGGALFRFESLLSQSPERLRQPLIEAAFGVVSGGNLDDPQRWISRLSWLPESSRARGAESIAKAWAEQSPEEAIGWVSSLAAGEARTSAVAGIASSWATKDAHGTAEWINTMTSGAERDRGAESLVMRIAERSPQEAWDWALSIGDLDGRTRAATQAAKMMAARDPATARQWIENGPFPAAVKAQLQTSLTGGKSTLPLKQ